MFEVQDQSFSTERVRGLRRSAQALPHCGQSRKRGKTGSSYSKGIDAETLAAETLKRKGFDILDRRYRTPAGELDLIVADRERLAFVEVKRRSSRANAAEAISARQQMRMTGAAEIWLQEHPGYAERGMTFDVVLICPQSSPHHIHDAFRPGS